MRNLPVVIVAFIALSTAASDSRATLSPNTQQPHETIGGNDRCPPYAGRFQRGDGANLVVTIVRRNDQPVPPHDAFVANPPKPAEAETWVKKGDVEFNAHVDAESGRLFIHWESVRPTR
ncbi:MAG TPA: hypothetical protein VHK90_03050 [Thermoanaerobaculia bacterium]|nr:hypothetical protein [Thermoanaerobaculia bacterium]